jgi:predicted nucleic acid-binding protein
VPRGRARATDPGPSTPDVHRYVVDAAVVAKWLFPEEGTGSAIGLFDAWAAGRVELLAPDVLVHELGAICRRKVRAGDLPGKQVDELFGLLLGALPELTPSAELAPLALQLALRHDRAYADALHLVLALREADQRLFRALAPAFPCVLFLADLAPPAPKPALRLLPHVGLPIR